MKNDKAKIKELEGEVTKLKKELELANLKEAEYEQSRSAMLYMLEDLNETTETIQRNRKQWETTFDALDDPLFIHDGDMRIIRANRAYMEAAARTFPEIIGKRYYEVFPKMDSPFGVCKKAPFGSEETGEEEVTLNDLGKTFLVRSFPISGEHEFINYSIHIMEDITEQKQAFERSKNLLDISRRLINNLDLDFRYNEVCNGVVRLGYSASWITTINDKTNTQILRGSSGCAPSFLDKIRLMYASSPLGYYPSDKAMRTKEIQVANDLLNDVSLEAWRDMALDGGYNSMAFLPIMHLDKVIGILNVNHKEKTFPLDDIEFLQTFTNQTSTYIKNSQLFEDIKGSEQKIKDEMELTENLLKLSRATLETTDLARLMSRIANCTSMIFNSDYSLTYIWDMETQSYSPAQAYGLPSSLLPTFRSTPLKDDFDIIRGMSKDPVIKTDLPDCPLLEGVTTVALIPLTAMDKPLGIIVEGFLQERSFTTRDKLLMGGVANQVSVALQEARLYRDSINSSLELSKRVETIQVLYEIDRVILSILDINEILDTAAKMVERLVPCDKVSVLLMDNESKTFNYAAGSGILLKARGTVFGFDETSMTDIVGAGRPQSLPDLRIIENPLPIENSLVDRGIVSVIRVPLKARTEVVGILSVSSRRPAAFTGEDLLTLEKLAGQMTIALENARLVTDLEELFVGTISSLSGAIDAKSKWTAGHSRRVTQTTMAIAEEIDLSAEELKHLELGALLHDVGKIGTVEYILDKPGKLTEEELRIMQEHPAKGAEILEPIKQFKNILPAIRSHQERFDGSGYPDKLAGRDIPLFARIIAVADTIDAMSADRPYRPGLPIDIILAELKKCSGTQFDPNIIDHFFRAYDRGKIMILTLNESSKEASA